jgi:NitT/TauT family transport system substrate-binding protein
MKRAPFIGGVAATATSFGARSAGAQDLTTIRVGVLGIGSDAPNYIADSKGYFRDHGIKIEPVKFTSSEVMMPLLSSTGLDVGAGAPAASLYNAVIRGIDIRAVADASTDPKGYGWSKLLIRADLVKSGRFKTIKDLKGMTIAGAAKASSSACQMSRLTAMAGIAYSDVQRTVLPYSQHAIALQNGAIDGALTIEPFATLAVESGVAVAIMGNDQFYPDQEVSCVLCSATLIKSRRDVIVRYLAGFLQGVRYYRLALKNGRFDGPIGQEVSQLISAQTGAPQALVMRTTPTSADPNGRLNLGSMRADLAFYKAQGFIEGGDITVDRVVDTSLSAEATKLIGLARA